MLEITLADADAGTHAVARRAMPWHNHKASNASKQKEMRLREGVKAACKTFFGSRDEA
jgi:hypothetical protein